MQYTRRVNLFGIGFPCEHIAMMRAKFSNNDARINRRILPISLTTEPHVIEPTASAIEGQKVLFS